MDPPVFSEDISNKKIHSNQENVVNDQENVVNNQENLLHESSDPNLNENDSTEFIRDVQNLKMEHPVHLDKIAIIAKDYGYSIPAGIEEYYSDTLVEFAGSESSASSKSELRKPGISEESDDVESRMAIPEEFGEISPNDKPVDPLHDFIQKLYDEEETFDSGKEFDDDRDGDGDWIEPTYSCEDFVSQPIYYDRNSFRLNSLKFNHSLGYDSYRLQNLCVIDENTIVYLSGNYTHIYDVPTRSFRYIRSSGGGGLGHCAKHPSEPIFAVGERGIQPLIIIYGYPSLKVLRVLRGGADKGFNYLCFSPNGKWLLTLASKPDSSLTVWNWNMERIVLKKRNMDMDIWKVEYNPYIFGGIITSGVEHITFWKLIETFTGLKLLPTRGKWSNRTSCDISAFCALPENIVITPNTNNNIFVWEGDAITREIHRRNNKPLHDENIVYLEFKEKYDEIFTVGLEGKYKVWDYTKIARARIKGKQTIEMQPTFQRTIQNGMEVAKPMSFQRVNPNDSESEMYYMQGRKGSIWKVELAVKETLKQSEVVLSSQDGPILDIAPSPAGYYVTTIGKEGRLVIHNSKNNKLVMKIQLNIQGTSLLWLPLDIDKTASHLIIGYIDGTIRVAVLSIRAREVNVNDSDEKFFTVIQAFKPHNSAITVLSLDPHRQSDKIILSGSDDCRVFMYRLKKYKLEFLRLCVVGFVLLPDPIYSITWNGIKESFLAASLNGTVSEVTLLEDIPDPPINSFEIKMPIRTCRFKSVKSEVIRNMAIERNRDRKERRKELHEKKKSYKYKILEERKKKLDELNEKLKNVMKERKLLKAELKAHNKMRAKKEGETDKNLIWKQLFANQSSSDETDNNSENSKSKISISDISESQLDMIKFSDTAIEQLKNIINERKKRKGIIDPKGAEFTLEKKTDELIENIEKKLIEIKTFKLTEKENLNKCIENKGSFIQQTEINERIQTTDMNEVIDINEDKEETDMQETNVNRPSQFLSKSIASHIGLKFIVDELKNIIEEEINFENLEIMSEDEEVPPPRISSGTVPIYFADYINDNCIWISPGGYDAGFIYEYELGVDEPYRCTPITDFEDMAMTCILHVNGGYIIVGQEDGCLKVININPDNLSDLSNYWLYAMHDNINGKIKKIVITYDYRCLYSIGEDSSIFYYSVNLLNTKFEEKINLPQLMHPPCELEIDDYIAEDGLSLEDSLKKAEQEWMVDTTEQNKLVLQEKLQNLANKFEIIFTLNEDLPDSQKLPVSYFVVNEEYYNRTLAALLDKVNNQTRNLECELEKEKIIKNKIFNYFLNPVETHKIYIYAHSFYCKVTTFLQEKLTVSFRMAEIEAENIMMDVLKKGRVKLEKSLAVEPVVRKKYKRKEVEIRPFVPGEDKMLMDMPRFQKSVYTKIIKRRKRRKLLQNLLRIFKDQSEEKRKEFLENKIFDQPPKGVIFILKCSPLYKPTDNITKERKFYQLINAKRKIYNLMSHFNTLTLKAREMKSQALALNIGCYYDLKNIASEFEKIIWPNLPQKVEIFEPLEFPENMYMDEPPVFPHEKKQCNKYKKRLFYQLYEINKTFPIDISTIECGVTHQNKNDECTPWEMEFIFERKQFLMSEYIKKRCMMDELLIKFDNEVKKLVTMKIEYEMKIAYLKIYFLKYFEELQIIRSFQLLENDIDEKCRVFIQQKHIHILRINIRKRRVKKCSFDIVRCLHRCQTITERFLKDICHHPSPIKRFILKYFHKSWARELRKDDKGSSDEDIVLDQQFSSSSETDSGPPEAVVDEIDSDDIDKLVAEQQEEFIQVAKVETEEECGKELFDYTLETREKRFAYERQIMQRKQAIKVYNEEIKSIKQKVLMIQTIIAIFKVKKSLTLEEKHKQLSKIRTVVVLDSSQMQHFQTSTNSFPPMKETILFPLYTLKHLEAKKRNLKNKILTVDLDEKETLKHVQRMQLDIDYLNSKLQNIKDKIRKEKIIKFGCDVNLPSMEETILRRIIKDYKYDTFPFQMRFHMDIKQLEQELKRVQRSTTEQIKKNTFDQLEYGALLEQKRQYKEIIRKIQNKKQVQYLTLEEINHDTEKLKNLLKIQETIKETLANAMNEIKFPKVPLLQDKVNMVKKKLIDDLLYKTTYESGTDEEDSYGEDESRKIKYKPGKKRQEVNLESSFESLNSDEEFVLSSDQINDESPLDFTSDEYIDEVASESEEEEKESLEDNSDESDKD